MNRGDWRATVRGVSTGRTQLSNPQGSALQAVEGAIFSLLPCMFQR